jgi:two-component system, OmpR family, response regulator
MVPCAAHGAQARTHKAIPLTLPLRTFIVEDSPLIRENLVATLEEMLPLHVVGTAEDEAAAVRWFSDPANACELGIIDIFLKRGTGLGVLKAARSAHHGAKLVVLSNYATPDVRRTCLELGADEVFDKSNDIEALLGYCARLVAADGAGDAAPQPSGGGTAG